MTKNKNEVMEVLTGPERRRRWSADEKLRWFVEDSKDGQRLIEITTAPTDIGNA